MAKGKARKKGKIRRVGSTKSGRPKIEGERYTNGRLKPRGPNQILIAKRAAGDAEAGEHPLDFALSQQWISRGQHRDAAAYRSLYRMTSIAGPRLGSGSLAEVAQSEMHPDEVRARNISQVPDADIAKAWDKFFAGADEGMERPDDCEALDRWRRLNHALNPVERQQLFQVAVQGSWAFWMTRQVSGMLLGRQDMERKAALLSGLKVVGKFFHPEKPAEPRIAPVPQERSPLGRRAATDVPVRYETADGQQVQPESMHGRPFEVVVTQRRRG